MSTENNITTISKEAGSDLSAKQFFAVKVNSAGQLALAGDGEHAIGTLQDKPSAQGRSGSVGVGGVVSAVAADAIVAGADVAIAAGGKVTDAITTGDVVVGTAMEAASGDGSVIGVLWNPRNLSA